EVNLRDKKSSNETKKILESNLEEVNNLQFLSDNLIKLTQYQKSNGNITFENVSLKEVIDEACRKVANLAKHRKISIHNKVHDIYLQADRQSLSEAFVIFLDNAIKYSPKSTSVTLHSKTTDHSTVVNIKDEGMGIDKDDIPYLFDRFFRADKSRAKTDVFGYGLGLSIAKQIIDRHQGSIKVESEVGKGTIFSIQLPFKHQQSPLSF
ncbi:MAG: HAMP domain-containing sensor histidine kinase, partial [Candidatus Wolfebacteria bacterium]|nr:HAMP domain-containing sensor histidine kinase [Candidatus Wolfebacteria bacterium]